MAVAHPKGRTSQRGNVHVVELPHSVLVEDVCAKIEKCGLTLDEFVRLGETGELEDDRLRDLWLLAGPALR